MLVAASVHRRVSKVATDDDVRERVRVRVREAPVKLGLLRLVEGSRQ
jgi:hypothetical protein